MIMKTTFRHPLMAAFGAVIALGFSSCEYDPYYSSYGGSYSSGYGDGYGYGSSSFSTSFFVGTGDPRWGYDPHTYCYYDYYSHRYYDPYLYGYYPVGYRPVVVVGAPHPHGWRPGYGHCPPPSRVRDVVVVNYRDRESCYRKSDYSWAKQVRSQQPGRYISHDSSPSRGSYYGGSSNYNRPSNYPDYSHSRPYNQPRTSYDNAYDRNQNRYYQPERSESDHHKSKNNSILSRYDALDNNSRSRPTYSSPERSTPRSAPSQPSYQERSRDNDNRRPQYERPREDKQERSNKKDSDDNRLLKTRFRGLGDG